MESPRDPPVFYHIFAPGHSDGDPPISFTWTMDHLASLVNSTISSLSIHGKYILLGEGAGSNVILRSACETRARFLESSLALKKVTQGAYLAGVVAVQGDIGGVSVGGNLRGYVGELACRGGFLGKGFGLFGVEESLTGKGSYIKEFGEGGCNVENVVGYARGYNSSRRTFLGVKR